MSANNDLQKVVFSSPYIHQRNGARRTRILGTMGTVIQQQSKTTIQDQENTFELHSMKLIKRIVTNCS